MGGHCKVSGDGEIGRWVVGGESLRDCSVFGVGNPLIDTPEGARAMEEWSGVELKRPRGTAEEARGARKKVR